MLVPFSREKKTILENKTLTHTRAHMRLTFAFQHNQEVKTHTLKQMDSQRC